jgi:hypothetical protein
MRCRRPTPENPPECKAAAPTGRCTPRPQPTATSPPRAGGDTGFRSGSCDATAKRATSSATATSSVPCVGSARLAPSRRACADACCSSDGPAASSSTGSPSSSWYDIHANGSLTGSGSLAGLPDAARTAPPLTRSIASRASSNGSPNCSVKTAKTSRRRTPSSPAARRYKTRSRAHVSRARRTVMSSVHSTAAPYRASPPRLGHFRPTDTTPMPRTRHRQSAPLAADVRTGSLRAASSK